MANGEEDQDDQTGDDDDLTNNLVARIPLVGESNGEVSTKVIHTGPLTDAEYNNLLVRQNETSLDALVRGVVTNDRTNMASVDQISKSEGNFRRWIQSKFHYELASDWEWVASKEGKAKLDAQGKPVPSREEPKENKSRPKNDKIPYEDWPIKVDKKGKVVLEMEYPEPVCVKTLKRKWINPEEARRLIANGRRLITSEEEEKLRKEEKRKFTQDPKEYGPFLPLEYEGVIVTERLWFLSGAQTERNIIGPREAMTKIPKRLVREFVDFLVDWQRDHPETPIKDFYTGVFPEKRLPKDQWVELEKDLDDNDPFDFERLLRQGFNGPNEDDPEGEPRLRLGNLVVSAQNGTLTLPNYYELGKIAEYYLGFQFFSAEVRYKVLVDERERIKQEYRDKFGKEITGKKLAKAIDKAYQFWLPYVQYEFINKWVPDKARLDKDPSQGLDRVITAAERADANFAAVNQISFIVVEPVQTGPGKVDLATAVIYFPINEEIRDLARMCGHFQQCKSQKWRFDKFNYSETDMNNAVGADHGGAMSGGEMRDDLIFAMCEEVLAQWEVDHNLSENERWDLRRALLGPVQSMTAKSSRLAAPELYGEYGLRRVDITKGAQKCRGLIPVGRKGAGLKWDRKVITDEVCGLRQYPKGHGDILSGETYFWYDPWDVTKNNGGLKSDGMVNAFSNRLWVYGTTATGAPLIRIADVVKLRQREDVATAQTIETLSEVPDIGLQVKEPVSIEWFAQQEIYRQLVFRQPPKNIIPHLQREFEEYKRNLEVHIRPLLRKDWLVGLPSTVWEDDEFRDAVFELNLRSDQRVLVWAGWRSHGMGHTANRSMSLSFGDTFLAQGFGTDNGMSDEDGATLASNLSIMGWLGSQFDMAVKLVRKITYNHEYANSMFGKHEMVMKALDGGLHPSIANQVAEVLCVKKTFKWNVMMIQDLPEEVALMEDVFTEVEAHNIGREVIEIVKEGGVFRALRAA